MDFIDAAAKTNEVTLTTTGRKTGKQRSVTIWITSDGKRVYIRSGQGMGRDWPQNLVARSEATVRAKDRDFKVKARHVTDPSELHATTELVANKYGVRPTSKKAEEAVFELTPV